APEIPVKRARGVEITPEHLEETIPEALARPAAEAGGHGRPGTVALRQVAPGTAGLEPEADAIEDESMIRVVGTIRLTWREQRGDPRPLRLAQFVSVRHGQPRLHYPQSSAATAAPPLSHRA